ncbi:MAG: hypothetical protein K2N23_00695 [Clostridia bacterium]|nr:hypothetical protein [Clostridia bacterium]
MISCVVALAYISGLPLLYGCCSSPNLETAFPINHNKKLVYRFLSSLFMFLVAVAVIIALIAIVLSISSSVQNFLNSFSEMGLYSGLFSFAYIVVMYSSGMIAGFLQRRKHRNIFLILLCVAIFLSSLIMSVYTRDLDEYSGCRLPFSEMYYGQIGLPWLFITFWILIAAGMLGWSIYHA